MSFLEQIPVIGPTVSTIFWFIVVLSVVVFVHEYGHYIVGRWCRVHAKAFSIGFGPELFGWRDKHGTRWKFSAIPLGGYVLFKGMESAASVDGNQEGAEQKQIEEEPTPEGMIGFPEASVGRRAAIAFAGPLANFILTVVLLAGIAFFAGLASERPIIGNIEENSEASRAGFQKGDEILALDGTPVADFYSFSEAVLDQQGRVFDVEIKRNGQVMALPFTYAPPVMLAQVTMGSAADDAGLRPGDRLVAMNGSPLERFEQLQEAVMGSDGAPVSLIVERDGVERAVTLVPRRSEMRDQDGNIVERFLIGVRADMQWGFESALQPVGFVEAVQFGVTGVARIIGGTMFGIYELINGRADRGDLGGPIRIAEMSGEAAQDGFVTLIVLTATLSTAIGLLNLFPIPVLDGGHLVFYAIEAVRGKPLNRRAHEFWLSIGFALILMLMVFATWNDISRYI